MQLQRQDERSGEILLFHSHGLSFVVVVFGWKSFYLFIYFFKILFIIYLLCLFLAVLGLRFCVRAFSSCGERGPLFIAVRRPLTMRASHYRGLSCCGAEAPDAQAQ